MTVSIGWSSSAFSSAAGCSSVMSRNCDRPAISSPRTWGRIPFSWPGEATPGSVPSSTVARIAVRKSAAPVRQRAQLQLPVPWLDVLLRRRIGRRSAFEGRVWRARHRSKTLGTSGGREARHVCRPDLRHLEHGGAVAPRLAGRHGFLPGPDAEPHARGRADHRRRAQVGNRCQLEDSLGELRRRSLPPADDARVGHRAGLPQSGDRQRLLDLDRQRSQLRSGDRGCAAGHDSAERVRRVHRPDAR